MERVMGLGNSLGPDRVVPVGPGEAGGNESWADGDRAFARSEAEIVGDEAADGFLGHLDAAVAVGLTTSPEHPNANIAPVLGYQEPLTIGAVMGRPHPGNAPFLRLAKGQDETAVMPLIKLGPVGSEYEREETPSVFERAVLGDRALAVAFVILAVLFVACVLAMMGAAKADPYARVLPAIVQVESGGDASAVGDGGRAVGILQIHPVTVEDANRIARLRKLGVTFTLQDRLDAEKSRHMFRIVSDHYSAGAGDEVVARRWNGGPKGEKKAATATYWAKVRAKMIGGGK